MSVIARCDGSSECQAIEHVEGCFATMHRRKDIPRLPLIEENQRLRQQLQGAVCLTDAERERMLWWLHKPVPPGPMKALDEAIIRKLSGGQ
jgi:hypothetical protein